jgi:hypothetical protein
MKGIDKECNMKLSRRAVFTILAFVMVIAAVVALDPGTVLTSGDASAAKPETQAILRSATTDTPGERRIDYFPDQYANQAKEPAPPVATF